MASPVSPGDDLRIVLDRMHAARSISDAEEAEIERDNLIRWLAEILRDNPHDIGVTEVHLVADILSASIE
jgi:hypothetical protein